jgi:hypothetical protein
MLLTQPIKDRIETIIDEISAEYHESQALILTEDDLKCLLYGKLKEAFQLNLGDISWRMPTRNLNIYGSPVHTEVTWFDETGHLTIKPDITILEPNMLSILHGIGDKYKLPSKQFEFGGRAIIFELKFVRDPIGIQRRKFLEIKNDYEKIIRLNNRLIERNMPNSMFCYFIIFNKTDERCTEYNNFIRNNPENEWHKFVYKTGNVLMTNNRGQELGWRT